MMKLNLFVASANRVKLIELFNRNKESLGVYSILDLSFEKNSEFVHKELMDSTVLSIDSSDKPHIMNNVYLDL